MRDKFSCLQTGTRWSLLALALAVLVPAVALSADSALWSGMQPGDLKPRSISVLAFAPDGTLFLGDSLGGSVFAIRTSGEAAAADAAPAQLQDVEGKIAARLGIEPQDVLIHDLAVHPITRQVFLAV